MAVLINIYANSFGATVRGTSSGDVSATRSVATGLYTDGASHASSQTFIAQPYAGRQFDGWYALGAYKLTTPTVDDFTVRISTDESITGAYIESHTPFPSGQSGAARSVLAKYVISYVVTFDANGGQVEEQTRTVTSGATVGSLPVPLKDDAAFDGWYTEASGGTKIDANTVVTGDVTFYAHWIATYKVKYALDEDETGVEAVDTKKAGIDIEIRPAMFTRTGYTQTGWRGDDKNNYSFGQNYTIDADLLLVPIFTPNRYTITFEGDVGAHDPIEVTYGSFDGLDGITPPELEGRTFTGYFTEDGEQVYSGEGLPIFGTGFVDEFSGWMYDGDVTLHAEFSTNKYTVTFDANGGDGGWSRQMEYGETIVPPVPVLVGYKLVGWTPDVVATVPAHDVSYVAQWAAGTYTVTFVPNGGTLDSRQKDVTFGSTYGDLPTPLRPGYIFSGWYTLSVGGALVTGDTTVSIAGPHALYARWVAGMTSITFDANGGSGDLPSGLKIRAGDDMPSPISLPTRLGYGFLGFFDSAAGGVMYYTSEGRGARSWDKGDAATATLYAQWEKLAPVAILFDANGGTLPADAEAVRLIDAGAQIGALPVPTYGVAGEDQFGDEINSGDYREDEKNFIGWFNGLSEITSSDVFDAPATLTARWSYRLRIDKANLGREWLQADEDNEVVLPASLWLDHSFDRYILDSDAVVDGSVVAAGTPIASGTTVTLLKDTVSTGDRSTDDVLVTFDANGGTMMTDDGAVATLSIPCKYGSAYQQGVAFPAPERQGYRFLGWRLGLYGLDDDLRDALGGFFFVVSGDTIVRIARAHTLIAVWGAIPGSPEVDPSVAKESILLTYRCGDHGAFSVPKNGDSTVSERIDIDYDLGTVLMEDGAFTAFPGLVPIGNYKAGSEVPSVSSWSAKSGVIHDGRDVTSADDILPFISSDEAAPETFWIYLEPNWVEREDNDSYYIILARNRSSSDQVVLTSRTDAVVRGGGRLAFNVLYALLTIRELGWDWRGFSFVAWECYSYSPTYHLQDGAAFSNNEIDEGTIGRGGTSRFKAIWLRHANTATFVAIDPDSGEEIDGIGLDDIVSIGTFRIEQNSEDITDFDIVAASELSDVSGMSATFYEDPLVRFAPVQEVAAGDGRTLRLSSVVDADNTVVWSESGSATQWSVTADRPLSYTFIYRKPTVNISVGYADETSQTNGTAAVDGIVPQGGALASVEVERLGEVRISAAARAGYVFVGWYRDTAATDLYDKAPEFVMLATESITLYARFVQDPHRIYVFGAVGSNVPGESMVAKWRSKTYIGSQPFNPVACRVDALGYNGDAAGSFLKFTVDGFSSPNASATSTATLSNITSQDARRLPRLRPERYLQVEVEANVEVDALFIGTSMGGLAV